jgi:hypothetical protein
VFSSFLSQNQIPLALSLPSGTTVVVGGGGGDSAAGAGDGGGVAIAPLWTLLTILPDIQGADSCHRHHRMMQERLEPHSRNKLTVVSLPL